MLSHLYSRGWILGRVVEVCMWVEASFSGYICKEINLRLKYLCKLKEESKERE